MTDTLQPESINPQASNKKKVAVGVGAVGMVVAGAGATIGYHAATSHEQKKPVVLNYTAHNNEVLSKAKATWSPEIKKGDTRLVINGAITIDAEHASAFDPVTKEPVDLSRTGTPVDSKGRVNVVDPLLIKDTAEQKYYVYFTNNEGKASQVTLNNAVFTNSNATFETGNPIDAPSARLEAVTITGNSPTGSFVAAFSDGVNTNIAAAVEPAPAV